MELKDCVILDSKLIYENGSLRTFRYWLKGWVRIKNGKHMIGLTGKETIVDITYIMPTKVFWSV